ncbi:hypothetical protein KP509_19G009000 [Ceratopteris richardii]|uniref:Homeobox domain-containing protein n=1 Tax=Ceratopteris richardii TaxID=49495 RepID=A0A8T2SLB7_CERRI|nr:hypothetical protein KP509_19G009000 [Ceratopteris richardii]
MIPRGRSDIPSSEADGIPHCPSIAGIHSQRSSSAGLIMNSTTVSCAENVGFPHLAQQSAQERPPQLQESFSTLHRWPTHAPQLYFSTDLQPPRHIEGMSRYAPSYIQPTLIVGRDDIPQQVTAQHTHAIGEVHSPMQIHELSMIPATMEQHLRNEGMLRSLASRQYTSRPEPRSTYGGLHQELQTLSGSLSNSSVLTRTLESIGRSAPTDVAAGARYEETCTPRPRWCPTQEQIQILESLFNSGTTTPSRDMIVDIAAQLRKYGSIAEANVFYWFQNRKARAKRKLQPAYNPATQNTPSTQPTSTLSGAATSSNPDHSCSTLASTDSSTQSSKSRRLSLKHASASSPTSSASSDHQQSLSGSGPTISSPLHQQITSSSKSFSHHDVRLGPSGGAAASDPSSGVSHMDQTLFGGWASNQIRRLPPPAEGSDVSPGSLYSPYSHALLPKQTVDSADALQNILDYSGISLSLGPPSDHISLNTALNLAQGTNFGYQTSYSGNSILHGSSNEGIVPMNPQGAMEGAPIVGIGASVSRSNNMASGIFQVCSRGRPMMELGESAMELNQMQSLQIAQTCLPSRPADPYSVGSRTESRAPTPASSLDHVVEREHLQMWEDLDPCGGGPWSTAAAQGGDHGHPQ